MLLAVYNGERHLPAQLASLAAQTGVRVRLHVADDGSSDASVAIVRAFDAWPVVWHARHPRGGASANFLNLICQVAPAMGPDEWLSLCDQDDIWHADKLARAVAALRGLPSELPAAYGARTLAVDAGDRPLGPSFLAQRPTGFANALVQCFMGGNTLVFNAAAAALLARGGFADSGVIAHDWLAYQLITGAGGRFVYDPEPCLRYRQHGDNAVGSNRGWRAKALRLRSLAAGDYREWNGRNIATLQSIRSVLTPENAGRFDAFVRARSARWPWQRLAALARSGVYRQRALQTAALWLACLAGKL
ncbi:glycosyltransferase [Xylophilus sp.]|uniref:glycosyltransferase n=1 Tax=Xylophilus sp. TaxID=2653893 RepID=UPI002D801EBF|nr:glycosyltransferase [Xylophilus sp.]